MFGGNLVGPNADNALYGRLVRAEDRGYSADMESIQTILCASALTLPWGLSMTGKLASSSLSSVAIYVGLGVCIHILGLEPGRSLLFVLLADPSLSTVLSADTYSVYQVFDEYIPL